ncbi:MAG: hypothetical protein ACXAB4_14380 [Candidatus Hodarchaeales archaeon]
MAQFKAFEEGIEVNGTTIMAVVEGMGAFRSMAKVFLSQAGLPAKIVPDTEHWYNQQKWLDAFWLIAEKVGGNTLYMIGTKIPENAVFPPEIDNIEKALAAIDVAYHMNHRNAKGQVLFDPTTGKMQEGIGHYRFQKKPGENKAILVCNNPYPCDFDRGIVTAMAQRFSHGALVQHVDGAPCRKNGTNSCTYEVIWKN